MNLGIIGTNFISDRLIEACADLSQITIHSIYSRKMTTGTEFGAKYGVTRIYDDLEAFLSDPELDAVYIASPNYCHCSQTIAALNHGKHVLVEKPAASNKTELNQMIAAAENNHVVLMEAMRSAYIPGYQWVREQLPKLGKIRSAQFQYCQYSSRYDKFKEGVVLNAFNPELSNAAVMDIGVYALYLFLMLFGKPETVQASAVILHNGMEGAGTALLGYKDMVGTVIWSKITEGIGPSVIQGENGSIAIDHISQFPAARMILRNGETAEYVNNGPANNMCFEAEIFADLVAKKTVDRTFDSSYILKDTILCFDVMDEVRRQTGIVFPADK